MRFVDKIELLENDYREYKNLDLTYAVRDGIISHCGELDENQLIPRGEFIDLEEFDTSGQYNPVTWEGCVVKLADKIAYVGRDIEDALCLGFLDEKVKNRLEIMARENDGRALNTTAIMSNLIRDVCKNSTPQKGIYLSDKYLNQLNEVKEFNYDTIYKHGRLKVFKDYSEMILTNIFDKLIEAYDGKHTWGKLEELSDDSKTLVSSFSKWIARYCESDIVPKGELQQLAIKCKNDKIYGGLEQKEIYIQAIIDYITGMTDRFAIKIFNEFLVY